jgi:hypothetical protein
MAIEEVDTTTIHGCKAIIAYTERQLRRVIVLPPSQMLDAYVDRLQKDLDLYQRRLIQLEIKDPE